MRTASWKVLLQQQGVINDILVWLGRDRRRQPAGDDQQRHRHDHRDDPHPAAVHDPAALLGDEDDPALLPARGEVARAPTTGPRSGGSTSRRPCPGIGAGAILVFILSIGYYITPELVGGTSGIFISNRIAYHISTSLNWGLAAALATLLLRRGAGALLDLRPHRRHRQRQARIAAWPRFPPTPRPASALWYWSFRAICVADPLLPDHADPGDHPAELQRRRTSSPSRPGCCRSTRPATRCGTTATSSPTPTGRTRSGTPFRIAPVATLIAVVLGTLAAVGLSQRARAVPRRDHGDPDLADDRAADHLGRRHVLLLLPPRPAGHLLGRRARPRRARHPLRHHHRHRDAGRLRPEPGARRRQPRRRPGDAPSSRCRCR